MDSTLTILALLIFETTLSYGNVIRQLQLSQHKGFLVSLILYFNYSITYIEKHQFLSDQSFV